MTKQYRRTTWLVGILFGLCFALFCVLVVNAAVTLVSFEAEGIDGKVILTWETASELDNAGFFIQRSNSETGTYQRVSFFIPSMGDDVVGAQYYFEDDAVTNGVTYWYKLEALDYSQNADFYGPIAVTPGIVHTATTTPTITTYPDQNFHRTVRGNHYGDPYQHIRSADGHCDTVWCLPDPTNGSATGNYDTTCR